MWRRYKEYRKRKRQELNQLHRQDTNKSLTKSNRNSTKNNHYNHKAKRSRSKRKDLDRKETNQIQDQIKETCIELELQPLEQQENISSTSSSNQLNQQSVLNSNNQDKQRPLISCLRSNRTENLICPINEQNETNHLSIYSANLSNSNQLSQSHSANFLSQNTQARKNQLNDDLNNSSNFNNLSVNNVISGQNFNFNNLVANLSNSNSQIGNTAYLASSKRRHGSVPTLYLRPNRLDNPSASNFLVSTLDGNYLTNTITSKHNQQLNNIKAQISQANQLTPMHQANSLHWSPRPTLIRSNEDGELEEEQLKSLGDEEDEEDDEVEREYEEWVNRIEQTWWYKSAKKLRRILKIIVDHRYFQRFIFLAILFNTLGMGIGNLFVFKTIKFFKHQFSFKYFRIS